MKRGVCPCAAAKKLELVTGKGLHSEGNVARLLLRYWYNEHGGGVYVHIPAPEEQSSDV